MLLEALLKSWPTYQHIRISYMLPAKINLYMQNYFHASVSTPLVVICEGVHGWDFSHEAQTEGQEWLSLQPQGKEAVSGCTLGGREHAVRNSKQIKWFKVKGNTVLLGWKEAPLGPREDPKVVLTAVLLTFTSSEAVDRSPRLPSSFRLSSPAIFSSSLENNHNFMAIWA